MAYTEMDKLRSGKGGKLVRRQREVLKMRVEKEGLPCVKCGKPIDTSLPKNDRMAFEADHPIALKNGGDLVDQELEPMHKKCNASKGNRVVLNVEYKTYR